jgi:hypothetical protein
MSTCVYCGFRDATTTDVCEGRSVPACKRCVAEEVPEPPLPVEGERMRVKIATALRFNAGASFDELRELLGVPERCANEHDYVRLNAELCRLVRAGIVRRDEIRGVQPTYTLIGVVESRSDVDRRKAFIRHAKRRAA